VNSSPIRRDKASVIAGVTDRGSHRHHRSSGNEPFTENPRSLRGTDSASRTYTRDRPPWENAAAKLRKVSCGPVARETRGYSKRENIENRNEKIADSEAILFTFARLREGSSRLVGDSSPSQTSPLFGIRQRPQADRIVCIDKSAENLN